MDGRMEDHPRVSAKVDMAALFSSFFIAGRQDMDTWVK